MLANFRFPLIPDSYTAGAVPVAAHFRSILYLPCSSCRLPQPSDRSLKVQPLLARALSPLAENWSPLAEVQQLRSELQSLLGGTQSPLGGTRSPLLYRTWSRLGRPRSDCY